MRCLGLEENRRRCANESVSEAGYCARHLDAAPAEPVSAPLTPVGQRLWNRVRGRDTHPIPDDIRLELPKEFQSASTAQVIQRLQHPHAMTRWYAACTLRRRRAPEAIPALWSVLEQDPFGLVRQQAVVALGKIGTRTVLGPLIEGLWHDPDSAVRQACAVALGNLGDRAAARDVALALERERALFVRWDCILALGRLRDPATLPLLAKLAEQERVEVVREACQSARAAVAQWRGLGSS